MNEPEPERDPLDGIVIDARDVDREQLAGMLEDRVGIDPETGAIVFLDDVRNRATIVQLVLLTLLGQRALSVYRPDEYAHPPGLTPKELVGKTGLKGGSVRPTLTNLAEEGQVVKSGERYLVPSQRLRAIAEVLQDL